MKNAWNLVPHQNGQSHVHIVDIAIVKCDASRPCRKGSLGKPGYRVRKAKR